MYRRERAFRVADGARITWALRAALVGRGDGVLAGRGRADLGGACHVAPHAAAALAGVGAGGEGLGGGVLNALVQAAVARRAAAPRGRGVRALLLARLPVTRDHLVLPQRGFLPQLDVAMILLHFHLEYVSISLNVDFVNSYECISCQRSILNFEKNTCFHHKDLFRDDSCNE